MFDTITPESIKAEILNNLELWDTREGAFASNLVAPTAHRIWTLYQQLKALPSMIFVDEGSGAYIDIAAELFGLTRKAGTQASATIHLTGYSGTMLNKGTVFLTASGIEFALEDNITIPTSGTMDAKVIAVEAGSESNIAANELVRMYTSIVGLTFANDAAQGGTNAESDEALLVRYYQRLQQPATSGNAANYEQWAMRVDGIGAARIVSIEDGAGTVGVILLDADMQPASDALAQSVATVIEANRPIGIEALPHVRGARAVDIHVTAQVTLDTTITADEVQAAFVSNLDTYIKDQAFAEEQVAYLREDGKSKLVTTDAYILINRIAYLLLSIPGVIDYTALSVNGGDDNIAIAYDAVAVLGDVEVTA